MITLKEYEIYLKVKKFIETMDCDENDIIPQLINRVGIIPAYVPLIIESDDMEPTKYYSLSAAARGCGLLKQTMVYACRNMHMRIAWRKGGSKVFRIEWLDLFQDLSCVRILFQSCVCPRENVKCWFWYITNHCKSIGEQRHKLIHMHLVYVCM